MERPGGKVIALICLMVCFVLCFPRFCFDFDFFNTSGFSTYSTGNLGSTGWRIGNTSLDVSLYFLSFPLFFINPILPSF